MFAAALPPPVAAYPHRRAEKQVRACEQPTPSIPRVRLAATRTRRTVLDLAEPGRTAEWPHRRAATTSSVVEPDDEEDLDELRQLLDALQAEVAGLTEALESRDVIGQAKGILMASQGISADEAFNILRRASQRLNVKLRDVAAQVVEGRASDDIR